MSVSSDTNTADSDQQYDPNLRVQTDVYEGPLELLLQLIQKRKLFINDISLSQVTDDFIAHVQGMERFPTETCANFLLTSSALMLLKSKSLLPDMDLTDDEEEDIQDLQNRLKAYQRIKEASQHVADRFGTSPMLNRHSKPPLQPIFSPTDELRADTLARMIRTVIDRIPKSEEIPQAQVKQVQSLKQTIESLQSRIEQGMRTRFSAVSGHRGGKPLSKQERTEVVVHFLAMLELVKNGVVQVTQPEHHGDIEMEARKEEGHDERRAM